jgi:hypothetical protein
LFESARAEAIVLSASFRLLISSETLSFETNAVYSLIRPTRVLFLASR